MDYAITVKNLHVSYQNLKVLENISLTIPKGKRIGILGPNGAGKSTLIKALMSLIPSQFDEIKFNGQCTYKEYKKEIAYVPQRNSVDWDFPIHLEEVVMMGRYGRLGLFKNPSKKDHLIVQNAIDQVNLNEYKKQPIGNLSGGQQQRTFIARALAQEAELYFMDEPFVGVDIPTEQIIISQLKKLTGEGKTVFIVHHDLNKAKDYFDYLILLNKSFMVHGPFKEIWTSKNLKKCFGAGIGYLIENESTCTI